MSYRTLCVAMVALALLLVGVRALWFNGFAAGADSAECLDLFTVIGDRAATYDVCLRAQRRYQHDWLARAFAKDAELRLRREAIEPGE